MTAQPFEFNLDTMLRDLRWLAGHTPGALLPAAEQMARTLGELHAQSQAQDATIRHLRGEVPVGTSAPGHGEARLVAELRREPGRRELAEIADALTTDLEDYRGRLFAIATTAERYHCHPAGQAMRYCHGCQILAHIPTSVVAVARRTAPGGSQ